MPRPTPTQFLYGSATVVLSTMAMLLLSGASSGPGVAVVVSAGLALGVLVAVVLAGNRYSGGERFEADGLPSGDQKPTPAGARSGPRRGGAPRPVESSLRR
jgi:hypothetical protein